MPSDRFWDSKFAWLRFGVVWIGYAWMRAVVLLPFRWQLALGKAFGRTARLFAPSRNRIVMRNLEACFPDMPAAERRRIARAHFAALGASLVEMAMGWFGAEETVRRLVRINGAEHLREGLAQGRGVILYSAHFTTFEFFWSALKPLCTRLCGMYKEQTNPVMNDIMTRGRSRNYDVLFSKDNLREMLRQLKQNSVVWYASDQSYTGKSSALLPFFGEPAMTNTAIGRIAAASRAVVLPYFCRRLPDDSGYMIDIGAPLQGWPTGNDEQDTLRMMALVEDYIRVCPDQYWWIHKRFKGRPAPLPDLYATARPSA